MPALRKISDRDLSFAGQVPALAAPVRGLVQMAGGPLGATAVALGPVGVASAASGVLDGRDDPCR
jgi:hypothetical protein